MNIVILFVVGVGLGYFVRKFMKIKPWSFGSLENYFESVEGLFKEYFTPFMYFLVGFGVVVLEFDLIWISVPAGAVVGHLISKFTS